jgi:hypothetical protein
MAWTPTLNILTARAIPVNLLTYVTDASRQADALSWALGGGSISGYRLIKTFSNSVANRTVPVYPSIAFSDDEDLQDFTGDTIEGAYSCIFEVSIQHANPDTAVTQARTHAKALCSMMVNCPEATLGANTGGTVAATKIQSIEVGFEQMKTNEMQNDFLQVFQIRTVISLTGAFHI